MPPKRKVRTALVLSGGGTRGAYEVGVVHYLRTKLPSRLAEGLQFDIHCGSSVGAINAAFMASMAHDPVAQGQTLLNLWSDLRTENIYRRGPLTLGKLLLRTLVGVVSHVAGLKGLARPDDRSLHFRGFFDTAPFFQFLREHCHWANISKNIDHGVIEALAISATNMLTGQLEIFIHKRLELGHSERLNCHIGRISPRHVMASAALPLIFPPVPIHGVYYNDGAMRLNTPLAPAVSLGAARILIIGTRYHPTVEDLDTQIRMTVSRQPTLGDVLGKLFHAILVDRLDSDQEQVDRINRILTACATHLDPDAYHAICTQAGVQRIETLSIEPTANIANLVDETARGSLQNLRTMGILERFVLRVLETDPGQGSDFLSYFLFEPSYLKKLIDLGYEDARRHHDALAAFAERAIEHKPVE
ncbi:MAG TPA: patatin-like phospholipase family protein [Bdellovibrionota bacterium]|nr:patatin-like phospholipase family protein [Bdellovibrionota bacterium]